MSKLDRCRILITGSSEEIGFGIAEAFAKEGANIWLVARNSELNKAGEKLVAHI